MKNLFVAFSTIIFFAFNTQAECGSGTSFWDCYSKDEKLFSFENAAAIGNCTFNPNAFPPAEPAVYSLSDLEKMGLDPSGGNCETRVLTQQEISVLQKEHAQACQQLKLQESRQVLSPQEVIELKHYLTRWPSRVDRCRTITNSRIAGYDRRNVEKIFKGANLVFRNVVAKCDTPEWGKKVGVFSKPRLETNHTIYNTREQYRGYFHRFTLWGMSDIRMTLLGPKLPNNRGYPIIGREDVMFCSPNY